MAYEEAKVLAGLSRVSVDAKVNQTAEYSCSPVERD